MCLRSKYNVVLVKKKMEKWVGKIAVVTGAASGIGNETSRQLVKQGMIVVGLDIQEDKLKEMKKEFEGKFYYVCVDLRSEESILEAFKWIRNTLKTINVMINNAAFFKSCDLLGSTDDWKQMFDINVIAYNICSREAVKIMKETNIEEGHIVNISSVAGHHLMSYMKDVAIYSSTKFCVKTFTEYLRQLMCMQKLPIRVTCISPGAVDTELTRDILPKNLQENEVLKPVDIADTILFALGAPKRVCVAEIIVRASAELNPSIVFGSY